MKQHYHWSIDELENMMPFEREVYTMLLTQHLVEEENRKAQDAHAR
jgi:hypothetical protein